MNKPSAENVGLAVAGKTIASTNDEDRRALVKGLIREAIQDDDALSSSSGYTYFRLVGFCLVNITKCLEQRSDINLRVFFHCRNTGNHQIIFYLSFVSLFHSGILTLLSILTFF